ncbi:MAG: recombinase family protein [Candidatus Eremiobacteraeota bacterium]|nr:recombinase family protein [Candidatus Eremiobacteraeota bacterium]
MKVVAYVRVSTEEQASHGVSLAAQEAKLRSYCELYDHDLVEVVVDAGQSAKSLNRPGLQQALEMLKTGAAQGLLVLKLDRLTRSVRDLGELLETYFQKSALISIQEQCDTSSAAGRLVLNVMTSVAQWERETTSERTSAALQYKKTQGVQLGAPALKDEITIARAVALKAEGLTLRQVAEQLTAEGFQTLKGGRWEAMTVKRLLDRAVR